MLVAVLEDDPALAAHVVELVQQAGHETALFDTGSAALEGFRQQSYALILLDWVLPDTDGLEVLAWVRENLDPSPPIIMVTARADANDIVAALAAGADDYISKPVQDDILKARMAAILRRVHQETRKPDTHTFGGYVLDQKRRIVTLNGAAIEVTDKEFALALMMFQNLDRPVSRGYLMDAVWGAAPNAISRTLDAHVSQIRTKLGLRPENGLRLSAVYAYGYRLERLQPD